MCRSRSAQPTRPRSRQTAPARRQNPACYRNGPHPPRLRCRARPESCRCPHRRGYPVLLNPEFRSLTHCFHRPISHPSQGCRSPEQQRSAHFRQLPESEWLRFPERKVRCDRWRTHPAVGYANRRELVMLPRHRLRQFRRYSYRRRGCRPEPSQRYSGRLPVK